MSISLNHGHQFVANRAQPTNQLRGDRIGNVGGLATGRGVFGVNLTPGW